MREEYKSRDLRSKDPHDYNIVFSKKISQISIGFKKILKGG